MKHNIHNDLLKDKIDIASAIMEDDFNRYHVKRMKAMHSHESDFKGFDSKDWDKSLGEKETEVEKSFDEKMQDFYAADQNFLNVARIVLFCVIVAGFIISFILFASTPFLACYLFKEKELKIIMLSTGFPSSILGIFVSAQRLYACMSSEKIDISDINSGPKNTQTKNKK